MENLVSYQKRDSSDVCQNVCRGYDVYDVVPAYRHFAEYSEHLEECQPVEKEGEEQTGLEPGVLPFEFLSFLFGWVPPVEGKPLIKQWEQPIDKEDESEGVDVLWPKEAKVDEGGEEVVLERVHQQTVLAEDVKPFDLHEQDQQFNACPRTASAIIVMNPLLNRIFKSKEHGPPRLSSSRRNSSLDKSRNVDKDKLVPKIISRQFIQPPIQSHEDAAMKMRIILPPLKQEQSATSIPQTPLDGTRNKLYSSLRKRGMSSIQTPVELAPYETTQGFFPTQTETVAESPIKAVIAESPSKPTSEFKYLSNAGLTKKLFGDQQKLEIFDFIKTITVNEDVAEQFCYMNRGEKPYDYRIVEYEDRNRLEYLTVSIRGITFYTYGQTEFYTKEMLLREIKLYNRIKLIPFFVDYLKVKTMKIWKNQILKRRFDDASAILQKQLYGLNKPSEAYMKIVGETLHNMKYINYLDLHISQTKELHEFEKDLKDNQLRVEKEIKFFDDKLYTQMLATIEEATKIYRKVFRISIGENNKEKKGFLLLDSKKSEMRYTQLAKMKEHQMRMYKLAKLIDQLREAAKLKSIENGLVTIENCLQQAYSKFYKDNSGTHISWIKIRIKIEKVNNKYVFSCSPSADVILSSFQAFVSSTLRHICRDHSQFSKKQQFSNVEREQEVLQPDAFSNLKRHVDDSDIIYDGKKKIQEEVVKAFMKVQEFLDDNNDLLEIYMSTILTNPLQYYLQNVHLKEYLEKYESDKTRLRDIKEEHEFGIFYLDFKQVRTVLNDMFNDKYTTVTTSVPQEVIRKSDTLSKKIKALYDEFKGDPETIEQYIAFTVGFKDKKEEIDDIAFKIDELKELEEMLYRNRIKIGEQAKIQINQAIAYYIALKKRIEEIEREEDKLRTYFEKQLQHMAPDIESKAETLLTEFYEGDLVISPASDSKTVMEFLEGNIQPKFQQIQKLKEDFIVYQKKLATGYTELEKWTKLDKQFRCLSKLWYYKLKYDLIKEKLQKESYKKIDFLSIQSILNEFNKEVNRGFKELETVEILQNFKNLLDSMSNLIFTCKQLCDEDLLDRHYEEIRKLLHNPNNSARMLFTIDGFQISPIQLQEKYDIVSHKDEIEAVVVKASNEAMIIKSMAAIQAFWKNTKLEFDLSQQLGKNDQIFLLCSNDEISEKIDDNIIQLTGLSNSKYVQYVRDNVNKQKQIYLYFRELLDIWLETQKEWIRLYPIMMSASSIKYHSGAYSQFSSVDNIIRKFNKQMHDMINIKKIAEDFFGQGFLNTVKGCHVELEKLRKTLEEFINQKRNNYHRFYFLTDTELITLLQEVKDWKTMEPYLATCFDLDGFVVEKDMVLGVRSSYESFKIRSLFLKGEVDEWFRAIEQNTRNAIRSLIKSSLIKYRNDSLKVMWRELPVQVMLALQKLVWTEVAERSLESNNAAAFAKLCRDQVDAYISKLNQSSNPNRLTLTSIILQSMYFSEVATFLALNQTTAKDFRWFQQIRMYVIEDEVQAHLINYVIPYGYEYHRPSLQPVFTSLSEKIALANFRAFSCRQGLILDGPDATGKTHTIKHMSQLTGNYFKNYTCSTDVEQNYMLRFMAGVCLTGMWGCLDSFLRLTFECISLVLQKSIQIKNQRLTDQPVVIDRNSITVHRNTMFFISRDIVKKDFSMAKALLAFNSLFIVKPDILKICQWTLLADGFKNWKLLSSKICGVLDVCRQVFSLRNYTFELGLLKGVLSKAVHFREIQKYSTQEATIYEALRIEVMNNLLQQDKHVYRNFIKRFFDYEEEIVLSVLVSLILQHPKLEQTALRQRYQQLEDGFSVSGCVVITGTRTSKSTLIDIFMERTGFHMVKLYPKAQQNIWSDGMAVFVNQLLTLNQEETVLVFDGEIDSWVQLINASRSSSSSVVIVNGEKISFPFKMIFESRSVKNCPPSFLSTCKLVHIENKVDSKLQLEQYLLKTSINPTNQKLVIQFAQPYFESLSTEDMECFSKTLVSLMPKSGNIREKLLQKLIIWILAFIFRNDQTFWNKSYPGKYQDVIYSQQAEQFVPISSIVQDLILHEDQLFHDIIVCTKQLAYAKYLVSNFTQDSKHLLIHGSRLTFKTSTLRYCTRGFTNIFLKPQLTNQKTLQEQLDTKLTNIRKGNSLFWSHNNGPFIIQIDDLHLAQEHVAEALRKIAQTSELRLRISLHIKTLLKCSIVATTNDLSVYPRMLGPMISFPLDVPTSDTISSISAQLLGSFLRYSNFKREVIDVATSNCVMCMTILFNDMQKVNGMQLNSVRIFRQVMKHMLSIKNNVYIDYEDYVNLFVYQVNRITDSRSSGSKQHQSQVKAVLENALKVAFKGVPSTSYWISSNDKMQQITFDEVVSQKLPVMSDRILFEQAIRLALCLNNQHHVQHGHTILAGLAGSGKKFLCYLSSVLSDRTFIDIQSEMLHRVMQFRQCFFDYIKKVMFEESRMLIYQSSLPVFLNNKAYYEQLVQYTGDQFDFWTPEEKNDIDKEVTMRSEQSQNISADINLRLIKNLSVVFAFQINKDTKNLLANSTIFECYYCQLSEWPKEALVAAAQKITTNNVPIMSLLHYQLSPLIEKYTKHSPSLKIFERFIHSADQMNMEASLRVAVESELYRQVHYRIAESCEKIREWHSKAEILRNEVKVQVIRLQKNIERMTEEIKVLENTKEQQQEYEAQLLEQNHLLDIKTKALDSEIKKLTKVMDRLEKSLNSLSRDEFGQVKRLYSSHSLLKFSLECLAILMHMDITQASIHKMLADPNLLMKLKQMKLQNTDRTVKEKIRMRTHNNKEFTPSEIEKINISGRFLCEWIFTIIEFWEIYEDSEHKRLELKHAQEENVKTVAKVQNTRQLLEQLKKQIAVLEEEDREAREKKKQSQRDLELFEVRLANAQAITPFLMAEQSLCLDHLVELNDTVNKVTGNCILTSFLVYYLSPLDYKFRKEILEKAKTLIQYENIQFHSSGFLKHTIRPEYNNLEEWVRQNFICIDYCSGVPLILDPERKAISNLSKVYPSMRRLSASDESFSIKLLEEVEQPGILLVDDIDQIDYGSLLMVLNGDKKVSAFKLVLYTDLPYSKVREEIISKTIPINWKSSDFANTDKLLKRLIEVSRPDLVQMKEENKRLAILNEQRVKEVRHSVFEKLKQRTMAILEDEEFIEILKESASIQANINKEIEQLKKQQQDIAALEVKFQEQMESIELAIQTLREVSATSLSIAMGVIANGEDNLVRVIRWSLKILPPDMRSSYLFICCLRVRKEYNIQNYYVRYLFEEIPPLHQPKNKKPPLCSSLTEAAWKDLHALLQFGNKFEQLIDNISKQPKEWEVWFYSQKLELPPCLNIEFNMVETLLIIRTLKQHKLYQFMSKYIEETFSYDFMNPENELTDEQFLSWTSNSYPILLPSGLPAFKMLTNRIGNKHHIIVSLQRNKDTLLQTVSEQLSKESWVALVDCQIITPEVLRLLEDTVKRLVQTEKIHPSFRLFIIGVNKINSDYVSDLSVSMYLQDNTIKHMMKEVVVPECFPQEGNKQLNKLTWLLCLAHCVVSGKNRYPISFEKQVSVGITKLQNCLKIIQFIREKAIEVNYDALAQIFGQIYSTQADNLNDKSIIAGIFGSILDEGVANNFNLFSYPIPQTNFVSYVDDLPPVDDHEIFGFHFNIMIAMDAVQIEKVEQGSRAYRIQEISNKSESAEADLLRINDFARKVPSLIAIQPIEKWLHYSRNIQSMRLNAILEKVHRRFEECKESAHKDISEISASVRLFYSCVEINILPQELHDLYPMKSTNRSFTKWVQDLADKANFFSSWQLSPHRIFRPCCFFNFNLLVQSFKLSQGERKQEMAEQLTLSFKFTRSYDSREVLVPEGILFSDLSFDQCRYNIDRKSIEQPLQGMRLAKASVLHLTANSSGIVKPGQEILTYSMPMYAQVSRDRLIASINIETDRQINWLNKGAAIIST